jgi:hypothetical protein
MSFNKRLIHLVGSNDPLKEGVDRVPFCQQQSWRPKLVPKATFAFMWNTDTGGLISINPDTNLCCPFCDKFKQGDFRYLYGIVPGQESQNSLQESA